jgi:hypothetical protein
MWDLWWTKWHWGRAIALMMEAVCTSETSVDIQLRTWQYIPEDSELNCYVSEFHASDS